MKMKVWLSVALFACAMAFAAACSKGPDDVALKFMESLDYLKLGPYIEERGPLNHPGTNQHLYRLEHCFSANYPILATDGTQILGKYVMMHDITDKVK